MDIKQLHKQGGDSDGCGWLTYIQAFFFLYVKVIVCGGDTKEESEYLPMSDASGDRRAATRYSTHRPLRLRFMSCALLPSLPSLPHPT